MPDTTISNLPNDSTPTSTDVIPVDQGSTTKKLSLTNLTTFLITALAGTFLGFGGGTLTKSSGSALVALSGSATVPGSIGVGRLTEEGTLGISGTAAQFFNDAAAGDTNLRASSGHGLHLGTVTAGNASISIDSSNNLAVNSPLAIGQVVSCYANFRFMNPGIGLSVKEGSNAKQGTATLVSGTVTVANTSVTANSRIQLTVQSPGGTVGSSYVSSRTAGTSFVINSTAGTADTSTVAYEIFEPSP